MSSPQSPGQRLRTALAEESLLQLVGVVNAYAALLARETGFRAIYLSGSGVAAAAYGLPDLGYTTRDQVTEEARRITAAVDLPLLVDVDTGWDDPGLTVAAMEDAGVAGMHLEDQVEAKRCGHREGKKLVSTDDMLARLAAALAARRDPGYFIMARTDAAAVEGLDAAIERARRYVDAGADAVFAEALTSLDDYRRFTRAVPAPVLANITEFGKTPLYTRDELRDAGVAVALYPLSAFRAMNEAALSVFRTLREQGTQQPAVDQMQTRAELYRVLDYERHEREADAQLEQQP